MFQTKEQGKAPEEELSEVETGNLPEKVMIVKMIKELRRRMDAQSERLDIFNRCRIPLHLVCRSVSLFFFFLNSNFFFFPL